MSPRARGREFPPGIMSISVAAVTENKGKYTAVEPKADRLASICHGLWEWVWKGKQMSV